MKLFIVAMLLAFTKAGVINVKPKCVIIHENTYEEEVLKDNILKPYQLAIDYDTNTLFFSYSANEDEMFRTAYLSLKTYDYGIVSGISGGFANAVNSKDHIVYMGGNDGLYKYDYITKSASKLKTDSEENIWQMFYKDGLYFTTYPDEKVLLYNNEKIVDAPGVKGKAMLIAVKNDGNYVYSNFSGVYTYDKVTKKTTNIGDHTVNGITADINGKLYFSTPTGIYSIADEDNKIEELTTLEDVYGVAIEGNGNIIYANENSVVRLKSTKLECMDDLTVKGLE